MISTSYLSGRNAIQEKRIASGWKMNCAATAKNPKSIVIGIIGKTKTLAMSEIKDN